MELPDAPPEEYPRAFGNYALLAPLARGGMGEVFLAKHGSVRGLEKHCVVKTLRPHLTDDREYTARFIDEARIVVQLGHRNICHVFDVGTVGERYYLAMEYIAGKDLRALTHDVGDKGGVVNPGVALHVVCEVLEALDYAHRHKDAATGKPMLLVHRDVSPQNVMLSWEGEVKLIDFGLAASTLKMEQTSPNVVMGKLAYMAPEQVRGEKVDGRADLFAVAVMLYEMLIGERFYEGRSPYEIWGLAAQGGYRPRGFEVLDVELRAILDKALAGKAESRHHTCLELREALVVYRTQKALYGDSPMLRALMHELYAQQIEDSSKQLALLTSAAVKNADPLARHPSGVFSVSTEPTVSLARSPSSSEPLPPGRRQTSGAEKRREATEPTELAVKAMFGPRRRGPLVAAVAAVVVALVAVGVGARWAGARDAERRAATPPAVIALDKAPPVGPPHVVDDAAPVDAKPAVVSPVVVASASHDDAAAHAAHALDDKRASGDDKRGDEAKAGAAATKAAGKRSDEKPGDAVDDAAAAGKRADPADAAREEHGGDKGAGALGGGDKGEDKADDGDKKTAAPVVHTDKQRLDALEAQCGDKQCTQALLLHRKEFAGWPLPQLRAFKAKMSACEAQCGIASP